MEKVVKEVVNNTLNNSAGESDQGKPNPLILGWSIKGIIIVLSFLAIVMGVLTAISISLYNVIAGVILVFVLIY